MPTPLPDPLVVVADQAGTEQLSPWGVQRDLEALANAPSDGFVSGDIRMTLRSTARPGWAFVVGQTYTSANQPSLAAALGVTGSFTLPDMQSRVPVGAGTGAGLTNRVLGTVGGEENHVLTVAELAAHNHGVTDPGHTHAQTSRTWDIQTTTTPFGANVFNWPTTGYTPFIASATTGISIQNNGSGTGHNTMQPWVAVNFEIKL